MKIEVKEKLLKRRLYLSLVYIVPFKQILGMALWNGFCFAFFHQVGISNGKYDKHFTAINKILTCIEKQIFPKEKMLAKCELQNGPRWRAETYLSLFVDF